MGIRYLHHYMNAAQVFDKVVWSACNVNCGSRCPLRLFVNIDPGLNERVRSNKAVVMPFLGLPRHRRGGGKAALLQSIQAAWLVSVNELGGVSREMTGGRLLERTHTAKGLYWPAYQAKSMFPTDMNHEIPTPLNAV